MKDLPKIKGKTVFHSFSAQMNTLASISRLPINIFHSVALCCLPSAFVLLSSLPSLSFPQPSGSHETCQTKRHKTDRTHTHTHTHTPNRRTECVYCDCVSQRYASCRPCQTYRYMPVGCCVCWEWMGAGINWSKLNWLKRSQWRLALWGPLHLNV